MADLKILNLVEALNKYGVEIYKACEGHEDGFQWFDGIWWILIKEKDFEKTKILINEFNEFCLIEERLVINFKLDSNKNFYYKVSPKQKEKRLEDLQKIIPKFENFIKTKIPK